MSWKVKCANIESILRSEGIRSATYTNDYGDGASNCNFSIDNEDRTVSLAGDCISVSEEILDFSAFHTKDDTLPSGVGNRFAGGIDEIIRSKLYERLVAIKDQINAVLNEEIKKITSCGTGRCEAENRDDCKQMGLARKKGQLIGQSLDKIRNELGNLEALQTI